MTNVAKLLAYVLMGLAVVFFWGAFATVLKIVRMLYGT